MKFLAIIALSLMAFAASASETCYQISKDGKAWSKTAELICVDSNVIPAVVTFKVATLPEATEIATFSFDQVSRARCMCNQDRYYQSTGNSFFGDFAIQFNGTFESGKVTVGEKTFFYRNY